MAFSNVPISTPIYYPDLELIPFNGFAWTNKQGLVLQSTQDNLPNSTEWFSENG